MWRQRRVDVTVIHDPQKASSPNRIRITYF